MVGVVVAAQPKARGARDGRKETAPDTLHEHIYVVGLQGGEALGRVCCCAVTVVWGTPPGLGALQALPTASPQNVGETNKEKERRLHAHTLHPPAAVIVVDGLLRVVVGDHEVVGDVVPLLDHVGLTRAHLGDVHLPVPAVEGAVVTRLADPTGSTHPLQHGAQPNQSAHRSTRTEDL